MKFPDDLRPGDCLLYAPASFMGFVIAVKTWHRISHVEIYSGSGMSVASRDGVGVNSYPFRRAQLAWVLRPKTNSGFSMARAWEWFNTKARGQKYDWLGLLCFTLAVKQGSPDKMFCSEFATRFYREGGCEPFNGNDADTIAPFEFLLSGQFWPVWKIAGGAK